MAVTSMHRIGAGPERLALAAAVRRVAGGLAVDDVGGNGQHALSVSGVAIGPMLADLLHEARHELRSDAVHPIVVVAKLGNCVSARSFDDIVDGEAGFVANRTNLGVFDRR